MEAKSIETTGVTVDLAIEKALEELKCTRDGVDVEIISKGNAFTPATVKVTQKQYDKEDVLRVAKELINQLGFDVFVELRDREEELEVFFNGNDVSKVIGPKGEMLNAIQTLLSAKYKRVFGKPVTTEADGYREKRADSLITLANKMASRALHTGRNVVLEPMPSWERRVIHSTLADTEEVETQSQGQDSRRQVVIIPNPEFCANDKSSWRDSRSEKPEVEDGETYTGFYTDGVIKLDKKSSNRKAGAGQSRARKARQVSTRKPAEPEVSNFFKPLME